MTAGVVCLAGVLAYFAGVFLFGRARRLYEDGQREFRRQMNPPTPTKETGCHAK